LKERGKFVRPMELSKIWKLTKRMGRGWIRGMFAQKPGKVITFEM